MHTAAMCEQGETWHGGIALTNSNNKWRHKFTTIYQKQGLPILPS